MEEKTEKKFWGIDASMVGVPSLFITILSVVIVLAVFAFNTIRADNARIEASMAELRAEQSAEQSADIDKLEASIADLRAEQSADIDKLEASIADLRAEQSADIDKLEASIEELCAEQKADIADLRAEQWADIDNLADKIASLDVRLDEIEREQARLQGAVDVLRSSQAQNP